MGKNNYSKLEELLNKIDQGIVLTQEEYDFLKTIGEDYQTKDDAGLKTKDKTITGAINELFQSANNGKEIIADAIGEPVSANDTFSAMGEDIDGLLEQFKTNMTNSSVPVESGDKFKQLIDKITTLVTPVGTAVATDVLTGKTFINSTGNTVTGTMANQGSKTFTPSASKQTGAEGYYKSITVNTDSNLKAENIKNGTSIFGVNGTLTPTSLGSSTLGSITANKQVANSDNSNYATNGYIVTTLPKELMYYDEGCAVSLSTSSVSTLISGYTVKFTGTVIVSVYVLASGRSGAKFTITKNGTAVVNNDDISFSTTTRARINYSIDVTRGDVIKVTAQAGSTYYNSVAARCPAIFCKWT